MKVGGQRHALATLLAGKRPVTLWRGGWIGPRASLDGFRKLAPTGIRSPDRPARSESLRRLSYPGPLSLRCNWYNSMNVFVLCSTAHCLRLHSTQLRNDWWMTKWKNNLERSGQGKQETTKNNSQGPGFETEASRTQVYIVTATSTCSVNVGNNVAN